jgi:hypothetical protein
MYNHFENCPGFRRNLFSKFDLCLSTWHSAMGLFEIAGRLASEGRGGWWAFLVSGLMAFGVATNYWGGDFPLPRCPACQKPDPQDDLL